MFTHPDRIGQLARENHRDMLAEASQRRLRHQHGRRPGRTRDAATRISRRLAGALARAGVVAAETPGATWPTSPAQLSAPAAEARPARHGH